MSQRSVQSDLIGQVEKVLLEVARRADELVRMSRRKPGLNLHCWLVAEREVLGAEFTSKANPSSRPLETS